MNLSLNLSLFQLSFNELSLYEYESSDELGIYLRCTCTSMADNNLLTMDPTDDSFSILLSHSLKTKKNSGDDMSTQLILSEGSRLHITMKINTTVS